MTGVTATDEKSSERTYRVHKITGLYQTVGAARHRATSTPLQDYSSSIPYILQSHHQYMPCTLDIELLETG